MFTTEKTTQAAAYLLQQAEGTLHYATLLKMLYLSDKRTLLKWNTPMIYDRWFATPIGPILSRTYDLMRAPQSQSGYWGRYIRTHGFDLVLIAPPGDDLLSEAEEEIMSSVFTEFAEPTGKIGVEIDQAVSKWEDIEGASHAITYRRVLEDEGFPFESIDQIVAAIEATTFIDESLSAIDTQLRKQTFVVS